VAIGAVVFGVVMMLIPWRRADQMAAHDAERTAADTEEGER
jgi:neurotransmitter:Na+ symporter, NSS family